jgi:hypothetical protein
LVWQGFRVWNLTIKEAMAEVEELEKIGIEEIRELLS